MTKLRSVLFDLDGTLLDSAHDITQAINLMLAEDGRESLSLNDIKPMLGDGAMELCRRALLKTGGVLADDLFPYVQKFITYYRNIKPDPEQIFAGGREVLEELQNKGIKLGVCTNKSDASTHSVLDGLDLSKYFGFMAGGDTFTVHKPHPAHVTGVLEKLGVGTEGAVFVGDGPRDVQAAQAAGIPCLLVKHGYRDDYASLGADGLVNGFGNLIEGIKGLGFEI